MTDDLDTILDTQRRAFTASRPEPLDARRDRIRRVIALLVDHADELCDAMSEDFGNRSREQSKLTDIVGTINFGKYCLKHMDEWSREEKRGVQFPLGLLGAKARLRYEPKGVVGILSPWNFPVNLSLGPLCQVLAAGNRAMIKPSEFTEATSALTKELVERYFSRDEVAVVTGGPEVAQAFSGLPFDHLLFTGSTATGRKVMEAAAKNLVPVTLELGGKSPVVLGRGADLTRGGRADRDGQDDERRPDLPRARLHDGARGPGGRGDRRRRARRDEPVPHRAGERRLRLDRHRQAFRAPAGHGRGRAREGRRSDRGEPGERGFRRHQQP